MITSTGRAGVATSCAVCPSDQAEYTSQADGRPLCWQCWRGEQIAEQLVGETGGQTPVGETDQERERAGCEDGRLQVLAPLYNLLLRHPTPY